MFVPLLQHLSDMEKKCKKQRTDEMNNKKKRDTIIPAALILMKCKRNSPVKEAVIARTVL